MRWSLIVIGLAAGTTQALAAAPARTHGELDARIDGIAREADATIGARLRAIGLPGVVIADLTRIVESTRAPLHAVPPMQSSRGSAVIGLGAALELDHDTLKGSWRDVRPGSWRGERSLSLLDGGKVRQRSKIGGVVRERILTRVDRGFRLGIVEVPEGSLSVKTTRQVDSPLGPGVGQVLGSSGIWIRPDGSRQSMSGPFTADLTRPRGGSPGTATRAARR